MSPADLSDGCPFGGPDTRVCEVCGYDLLGEAERPPPEAVSFPFEWRTDTRWEVVIEVDGARYRQASAGNGDSYRTWSPRVQPLTGSEVLIGRRRPGYVTPDIDLGVEPADAAVSHRHAVLVARPGGGFMLKDLASTNGTRINDDARPVPPFTGVEISDGDRIGLGRWTTITVRRLAVGPSEAEPDAESA